MNSGLVERLALEKAVPRHRRAGRSISVSAVPFGPGMDFGGPAGSLERCSGLPVLCQAVLVGLFVPCDVGANYCRLRHIEWEKCGHGLASRPRESASEVF